jgi:glutamine amidotransferase PdxT
MADKADLIIGVLALQGAFLEHVCALERCGVDARVATPPRITTTS